jgi:hypothetical protein
MGLYEMSGFGPGGYTITPTKGTEIYNMQSGGGIFADDASLIAQHVVGLVTLNSVQLRAADVAGFGPANISSYEAALIARWTVNINTPASQTGQWKFMPVNRMYPNMNANDPDEDYLALLMGDVNGSWTPGMMIRPTLLERPDPNAPRVSLPNRVVASGTELMLPFEITNLAGRGITSYQFDVHYDPMVIDAAEVAADVTGTISENMQIFSNVVEPGLLKVTVFGAVPVAGEGAYVNLRFTAIGGMGATSPLTIGAFRFNDGSVQAYAVHGSVTINEAPGTLLRGRLLTAFGQPISGTRVVIRGTTGEPRAAVSNTEGYFEFNNLTVGETYTLRVASRVHIFAPYTVSIVENVTHLDMVETPVTALDPN